VALGFDCGTLPNRATSDEDISSKVTVMIFDWGRSELNTPEKHKHLNHEEQRDRTEYWRYYTRGVHRLSYEATRSYLHRFGNPSVDDFVLQVMDFDSMTENDFIGKAKLRFQPAREVTVPLVDHQRNPVVGSGGQATITYSCERVDMPSDSALTTVWKVTIHRANNLLGMDGLMGSSSDPFVSLGVSNSREPYAFWQRTSVKIKTLDPTWDETLEVPVARNPLRLRQFLEQNSMMPNASTERFRIDDIPLHKLLPAPPLEGLDECVEEQIDDWERRLQSASSRMDGSPAKFAQS
jgi:hypothetical protein